jgi:hypothetical protein
MELAQELLELIVRTSAGGMAAVSRGRANSLKAIRPTGTRSLVSCSLAETRRRVRARVDVACRLIFTYVSGGSEN